MLDSLAAYKVHLAACMERAHAAGADAIRQRDLGEERHHQDHAAWEGSMFKYVLTQAVAWKNLLRAILLAFAMHAGSSRLRR